MLQGHRDLKVYQLSYELAMEIFHFIQNVSARRDLFPNRSDTAVVAKCDSKHRGGISQAALPKRATQ